MFLNRRIFKIKNGCMQAAVEQMKAESEATGVHTVISISDLGTSGLLGLEMQFASLADYETFWNGWSQSARAEAFFKVWDKLTESGGSNEIWSIQ